ncbi:MAG: outer membrane protein assembly factor BamD [Cryomorphaceae bacterium]|nr:outer membrane protein assembly factor BamD [Flavobacteriales bacterium]
MPLKAFYNAYFILSLRDILKDLRLLYLLLSILIFTSCSEYNKILKNPDVQKKYEAAKVYYEEEEYEKALSLFDELGTIMRGGPESENVHFYIANCHFKLRDYYFANYYYKNFVKTYPSSQRSEVAYYRSAYCSYLNSPKSSLDQSETEKAIDEFQLFLNRYPQTDLKDSTNTMIAELRAKLEKKAFDNAKLYYLTEDYKSATVALKNLMRDFPESPHREEIEFLIVKSSYLLAINSVESKKEERLNNTIENYHNFVDDFGNSEFIKEAEDYYSNAIRELDKMKF